VKWNGGKLRKTLAFFLCKVLGLGLIPWSPLANGFLTGKYSREELTQSRERASGFAGTRKHLITSVGVNLQKW
jgi:aryl-alcohol dehydrogenase-like predicted oxidoreductase